jgi:hypothetical protein
MPDRRGDQPASSAEEQPAELVLAALDRAVRHRPGRSGAPLWTVLEHLHVPRRSGSARTVHARLGQLQERGWVERGTERGVELWRLTGTGRRGLRRALASAEPPRLGESPQHARWRGAQLLAAQELDRFRERLRADLAEALRALDADPPLDSDGWFELGARLRGDCRRLGSAWHCLHEWEEPDDEQADVDADTPVGAADEEERRRRARRAGRRNTRLWKEPD